MAKPNKYLPELVRLIEKYQEDKSPKNETLMLKQLHKFILNSAQFQLKIFPSLNTQEIIEEISNTVILKIFNTLDTIEIPKIKQYVDRACKNAAINQLNKDNAQRRIPYQFMDNEQSGGIKAYDEQNYHTLDPEFIDTWREI